MQLSAAMSAHVSRRPRLVLTREAHRMLQLARSRAALCVRLHDAARPRRGLQASECRLLGLLEERKRHTARKRVRKTPGNPPKATGKDLRKAA